LLPDFFYFLVIFSKVCLLFIKNDVIQETTFDFFWLRIKITINIIWNYIIKLYYLHKGFTGGSSCCRNSPETFIWLNNILIIYFSSHSKHRTWKIAKTRNCWLFSIHIWIQYVKYQILLSMIRVLRPFRMITSFSVHIIQSSWLDLIDGVSGELS